MIDLLPPPVPPGERLRVSQSHAPVGFQFPISFKDLIATTDLPELDPAYFLATQYGDAVGAWTEILVEDYPDRVLVPFAKVDRTDDVFCFEGTDHSGNPPVLWIHTFTDPGWEYRGEWATFDEWLAATIEESVRWRQEWAETDWLSE